MYTRRLLLPLVGALVLGLLGTWKGPRLVQLFYHHGLKLVVVASGLETPWSLAFLPDGRMLVTERIGHMRLIGPTGGPGALLSGVPPVRATGEGGLLGVAIDPQFAKNRLVYWSYAEPGPDGAQLAGIAVARGRLHEAALSDVEVIFRDAEKLENLNSFGSRLAFATDGRLLITLGDRGVKNDAQRLESVHGKIIRINPDGSIPADNPFTTTPGANPAIWALGFRDPQGIAVDPATGYVWVADHGPLGGDELNWVQAGHNYGWPVITYGVEEGTGNKIGEGTAKQGMEQAALWWVTQGVPPTGMEFVSSPRYSQWRNQLLMGTLWGQAMIRIKIVGGKASQQQRLFTGRFERVRDVKQGPDGLLYVVCNSPGGTVIRLDP